MPRPPKRILPLLLALALTFLIAACTAPHDLGANTTDTDLWEVDERPDTEVPNQYPDGRALGGDDHGGEGDHGDEEDDGHD
jgi:outer membrane biogenesis lipoprotein LolB